MTDTPIDRPAEAAAPAINVKGRNLDWLSIALVVGFLLSLVVGHLVPFKVLGLPAHALVVHAATVLIPLFAIATVVVLWVDKWHLKLHPWLAIGGVVVSAIAGVAVETGEKLQDGLRIENSLVERHAEWADRMHWLVVLLALFVVGHFVLKRLNAETKPFALTLKVATTALAAVSLASVAYVGHLGAEAVWKDRLKNTTSIQRNFPDDAARRFLDGRNHYQPNNAPVPQNENGV